jgi:hypothetical protein
MNTATKQVYLSIQQFNKDLEDCLTIIKEPTRRNPYYVCEYVSYALYKSIVHIYITK